MNMRTDKDQAAYDEFVKSYMGICPFCDIGERAPDQVIETNSTMRVIRNVFPYVWWDNFDVADHLLIIPKRHVGNLEGFTDEERLDYFDFLRDYESKHYSFYSRAPSNPTRTVTHLHTHLIRPIGS